MECSPPVLSIIVPIYGVEKYLDSCIQSILKQTYHNLEIILIDDGAKGKEPEICDFYAQNDNRIKVIHKHNEGLVSARKTGLAATTADYVTFVDGDDYIASNQYEQMMEWIIKEAPDIVITGFTQVTDGVENIYSQMMDDGIYEDDKLTYLYQNMNCYHKQYYYNGIFPSTCLKIYKTELLNTFAYDIPNQIRLGEDSAFTFPFLLKCKKAVVDNSIHGYYYRTVPGSMSQSKDISLFTGSSALYDFLKPYYRDTLDQNIIDQLELLRTRLADYALSYWISGIKLYEVPKTCRLIKQYASKSSLFSSLSLVLGFSLPLELKYDLTLINQSKWRTYELKWMQRLLSSYLLSMAKKISGKA